MLRPLVNAVVATIIAPSCACCREPLGDPLGGPVCLACWDAIPPPAAPRCEVCGDTLATWRTEPLAPLCARCRRKPRVIARGRSIAPYEGSLREILHALKYDKRRSIGWRLGQRMVAAGASVTDGADGVVPVPLHVTRLYARGFNQAAELAAGIGLPVIAALRRRRRTVTQTDLPEAQRHANVNGAFVLRRRVDVRGLVLIVVDDVSTTGATLDACARVLLEAGAKEVRALTAARATARWP